MNDFVKMYIIFKWYNENQVGYMYVPKNLRRNRKFWNQDTYNIYGVYENAGAMLIKKEEILIKGKNLKYLKEKYPQYFI